MKLSKELYSHMKEFKLKEIFVDEEGQWFGGAVKATVFVLEDGNFVDKQNDKETLKSKDVFVANKKIVEKVEFKDVEEFASKTKDSVTKEPKEPVK